MCGHFAINYISLIKLIQRYGLDVSQEPELENLDMFGENGFFPAKGDAQSFIPVIRRENGGNRLEFHRWDLVPAWWKNPLSEKQYHSYNARSESLAEKATYKNAWRKNQRCIIPATEFFEWPDRKKIPKDQKRIEHRVKIKDLEIFSMAGLWDVCPISNDQLLKSCTIITTEANPAVAGIPHPRMPVILPLEKEAQWLDPENKPEDVQSLLTPYPDEAMIVTAD